MNGYLCIIFFLIILLKNAFINYFIQLPLLFVWNLKISSFLTINSKLKALIVIYINSIHWSE